MTNMIGDCLLSEHVCDLGTRYEEDGYYTYCRVCERENFTPYIELFPVARPPLLSRPKPLVEDHNDLDVPFGEIPF